MIMLLILSVLAIGTQGVYLNTVTMKLIKSNMYIGQRSQQLTVSTVY